MALTAAEIEFVREIVGSKTFSTIESLCGELNATQESAMRDDIDAWETVRNEHLRISGGDLGVDLDEERDRRAIRKRVMQRLGLPVANSGGLFYIPVGAGYADACDM